MDIRTLGALSFGLVIGWYVYYVNRYRRSDVQIGDITTLIGAIGGGAVIALYGADATLFGAYGIGLAIGFFAYFLSLVVLVGKSDNFDSDWFLDGRRKALDPGYDRGDGTGGIAMMPAPQPLAGMGGTNIYVGGAPAMPEGAPPAFSAPDADAADDPARPVDAEESDPAGLEGGRILANLGSGNVEEAPPATAEAAAAAVPSLQVDVARLKTFLRACMTATPRVRYGLGGKVPFHRAVPGKDFTRIDCSGFVREALRLATNPPLPFPDGSVVQHQWVRGKGFARASVADGTLNDTQLRIAFLRPQDAASGIGHVVLLHGGQTLESHGGVGPDSRPWTGQGWQSKCFVYVLS